MVHDGIRYPCPHCDHQASARYNLKIHIECVHDVIKYPCPHCDYQTTRKGCLKTHRVVT